MLGKPDATAILTKVAAPADTRERPPPSSRARRARCARSDRFQEANDAYRDAAAGAPADPAINTGVGRAVPREVQPGRSAEVVSGGAAGRSTLRRRRSSASARSARRRQSAAGGRRSRSRRSRSTRRRSTRTSFSRSRRSTPGHHDEARAGAAEGARGESVEPRGARAARRARVRRGQADASSRRRSPRRSRSRRSYGEVYRDRRRAGRAQLPVRRSGGADAARARRSIRRNPRTAGRPRHCTCCAPATSPRRAPRSRHRSRSTVRRRHLQPARHAGHARQVRDRPRRRSRSSA